MATQRLLVGCVSMALLAGAGAWALAETGHWSNVIDFVQSKESGENEDRDEQVIALDQAPEAVRSAAIKLAGDAKSISKVVKEEDDEHSVTFEIEYTQQEGESAVQFAAVLSATGELMELERSLTEQQLPPAVLSALRKEYPKATFRDPEFVTEMFYEVDVIIAGRKHEVRVDASGSIKDESDDDDHGGKHERDDERGHGKDHRDQD